MDSRRILLLKLERGRLKENADLIGSLFMTKIKLAAFSRSELSKEQRTQFYLYIDEFQNFATQTFIELLSEARKYGLSLIMAHQNLSQLPQDLQDSILANSGIQICFRISRKDAERLAKEFFETCGTEIKSYSISPESSDADYYTYQEEWEHYFQELQSLPNRAFYVKHKIEGGVIPLTAEDIVPIPVGTSQAQFGLKYLKPRKPQLKEEKAEIPAAEETPQLEKTTETKAEKKSRTLEEVTASLEEIQLAF